MLEKLKSEEEENTYFGPMQLRGPKRKGNRTALLSFLYSLGGSSSQRSGTKVSGLAKWRGDR